MKKYIPILLCSIYTILGTSYVPISLDEPPVSYKENYLKTPLLSPLFGIKTVVIDAGHGGKDPGCLGITDSKEKDIALAIALKLGKYIKRKTPDVKVIYTRSTDVFIDLDERAAIANRNHADLFICIHCNTACTINRKTRKKSCNEDVFGTETYVMGLHKTNANLNVARRENESILLEKNYQKRYDGFDPNSETGYILLTMQQSAYLNQSLNFAAKVQQEVKAIAGRVDKGVQQAGFLVLWRTAMPSVLIETEFISNTESEKFETSEKGQDKMARAIFVAFRKYKDEVEERYVKYDDDLDNNDQKSITTKKDTEEMTDTKNIDSIQVKKVPVINIDTTPSKIASEDSAMVQGKLPPPVKMDSALHPANNNIVKIDSTTHPTNTNITNTKDTAQKQNGNIVYKVQFLVSGNRIPLLSSKFKGLKDVWEYKDGNLFKYTAGEFKTLDEAMQYRKIVKTKDYKDCFVVKFKDGIRMKK